MSAHRISSLSAVGFLVVAGLALSGCSATSSDDEAPASSSAPAPSASDETGGSDGAAGSEQTEADACTALQSGIEGIQTDLTENLSTFQSDPAAASAALNELAATFSTSVEQVANARISGLATTASEDLTALTQQFEVFAGDPQAADVDALTQTATDVQTSFTALGEACS